MAKETECISPFTYLSSPGCGIANADYEVSLKSARDPNKRYTCAS